MIRIGLPCSVRISVGALLTAAVLLPTARAVFACMSGQADSVHFNSNQPDFGTPPRRACISWRGEHDMRPAAQGVDFPDGYEEDPSAFELTEDKEENAAASRDRFLKRRLAEAALFEHDGRWHRAAETWRRVAHVSPGDGSIMDRIEVLDAVAATRTPFVPGFPAALRLYLHALSLSPARQATEAAIAFRSVCANPAAGPLRDRALYQVASVAYEVADYPRAVATYQQLLRDYPMTPKREQALIMIGRCALLPATAAGRNIQAGKQALSRLLLLYPHSRFRASARGLQGRIAFLERRWPEALHCYFALGDLASVEMVRNAMPASEQPAITARLLAAYLRRLPTAQSHHQYSVTLWSIDRARKRLRPAVASVFSKMLLGQPDLAACYFYYRLYHNTNSAKELRWLARLADTIVSRHPGARFAPVVRVRLAEVYYQERQYRRALAWARAEGSAGESDRFLYVHGAALHKLHRYRAALGDFQRLLDGCPSSSLRRAAREEIAILSEMQGDYHTALTQYLALNYRPDVAYLLDIRMSIDDIRRYLQSADGHSRRLLKPDSWPWDMRMQRAHPWRQRSMLYYALGIRYLRAERWREAVDALQHVPHADYTIFSFGRAHWETHKSPDPLTAARSLERLHRAVRAASNRKARAAALYAYALYYSTHGELLLYNPALWQDNREANFDFYWNPTVATASDRRVIRDYMYAHESYARARALYLELVRRYPNSPCAPQALYRAACDARHLAHFNQWWNKESKHHDFWRESIRLMRQVAHRYPHSSVAPHARKYAQVFQQEWQGWASL